MLCLLLATAAAPKSSITFAHQWSSAEVKSAAYGGVVLDRYHLDPDCLFCKPDNMVVFRAVDCNEQEVVVKIVFGVEQLDVEQMKIERAVLAGALSDCPGVPKVLGWGTVTCTRDIEPVEAQVMVQQPLGEPLCELDGYTTLDKAWALAQSLYVTLQGIHRRGIIHRDLKPDNIVVKNGEATIIDFGMAVDATTEQKNSRGTRAYAAPSLCCLGQPATFETDFISLIYTMFSVEFGPDRYLIADDYREDATENFAPCTRPIPAPDTAAGMLLDLYLGHPSDPEARVRCWDSWHKDLSGLGGGTELEATIYHHEKRIEAREKEKARKKAEAARAEREEARRKAFERREQEMQRASEEERQLVERRARYTLFLAVGGLGLLALWRQR